MLIVRYGDEKEGGVVRDVLMRKAKERERKRKGVCSYWDGKEKYVSMEVKKGLRNSMAKNTTVTSQCVGYKLFKKTTQ